MRAFRWLPAAACVFGLVNAAAAPIQLPPVYEGSANTFPGSPPGCNTGTLSQSTALSAVCTSSSATSQMSSTISAAAPGTFSIATAVYALGNPKVNGYGNAESILQFTDHLAIRGMAVTTGRLQGLIAVQGAVSIDTPGWSEINNGYVLSGMFFGQTLGQQGTITKPVDVLPVVSGPTLGQDVLIDIPIAFGADGWYTASVFSICMSEQIFGSSFTTGAGNGWNADTRADQHRTRVRRAFRSGLLAARICSPEAFNVPALLTSVSLCAGHRSAFRAQVTSLTPTLVATLRAAWFPT